MTRKAGQPQEATEQRLEEIILAYLEAAEGGWAPNRDAFLAAYPEFKQELGEFLSSRAELERLSTPIRQVTATPPVGESVLGVLGDFRIIREIGRGGMGVVYEAQQISLNRAVALKVLPFAAALDPRQLQRFRNEAMAAANLRHEHIVPVFAVGAERGVHYYAMQYVDGLSLAQLIEELRVEAKPPAGPSAVVPFPDHGQKTEPYIPSPDSETRAQVETTPAKSALRDLTSQRRKKNAHWVAQLGRQAALGLQHAHEMGIVHRDIKPANLLLDGLGNLWIADFGLAHVNNDVSLTMTGELLGTLRYASPEQAMAKPGLVDHRSDIYSLGATLYELLTLRPLFDGSDRHQLLRQIIDQEPIRPTSFDRSIPQELESIILKALAKEPYERYSTAREFADDLTRFLENRPVLARPPRWTDGVVKWTRRHSGIVFTIVGALVVSVGALTVATVIAAKAYEREKEKALEAKTEGQRAENSFRQARKAVDQFTLIAEQELDDDPSQEWVRRRMLDAALAYYQEFLEQAQDDPAALAELEQTRDRVKSILADLAIMHGAGRHMLLADSEVQRDLQMTTNQRNQAIQFISDFLDIRRIPGNEFRSMTQTERGKWIVEEVKKHEAAINRILTPEQVKRLGQIYLQIRGPVVFREYEITTALNLTQEQRDRVRGLFHMTFPMDGLPPNRPPQDRIPKDRNPGDRQPQDRQPPERGLGGGISPPPRGISVMPYNHQKYQMDAILKLLTVEQLTKWKQLIGPEFVGRGEFGRFYGFPKGPRPTFVPFER